LSSETPPDREIYVRDGDLDAIQRWLEGTLGVPLDAAATRSGRRLQGVDAGGPVEILLLPGAAGAFTGVWCRVGRWPWPDDPAFARAAAAALGREIRCALGGWREDEPEQEHDRYLCIDGTGEREIAWRS
jgi:hypothetical protein